jgi:hypothetical protein
LRCTQGHKDNAPGRYKTLEKHSRLLQRKPVKKEQTLVCIEFAPFTCRENWTNIKQFY